PVFGQTRNGTPVITIGPYRYNLASGYKGAKSHPVFSTTLSGNPVINIGRYRFNKATSCRGRKVRWYCNRAPAGCRAAVFTFDNVIVDHRHEHNH
ncbi:hypothetical protein SFRURICE_012644, partial [Spodoptera frugiperda]